MLRIDQDLGLSIGNRVPVWNNRLLLTAFSLAAGLHLLALCLFRIPQIHLFEYQPMAKTPVTASADVSWISDGFAQTDLSERRSRHLSAPPRSMVPPLPELHKSPVLSDHLPLDRALASHSIPFLSWKTPLLPPLVPQARQIRLERFGPLAQEKLIDPVDIKMIQNLKGSQRFSYRAHLDQRLGRILWMEAVGRVREPAVDGAIKQLRFEPRDDGVIVSGEIELSILEENG